jgi:hypothetical protein
MEGSLEDGATRPTTAGELLRRVAAHELDPYHAADRLLEMVTGSEEPPE